MPVQDAIPVEIGEWLPDLPPLRNPGALNARNVIPEINSYRSLNSPQSFTIPLAGPALGSIWIPNVSGEVLNFAGDANFLYELVGGVNWNSRASGLTTPEGNHWSFAQFGNRVIATNNFEPVFYFDIGVSAGFQRLSDASPDAETPPRAQHIAVIRDFIFLGNLNEPDKGPDWINWSGFNSSEIWEPNQSAQSDAQPLLGRGGRVQAIVGGNYGLIFQENSIWRADYVGPPLIFNLDEYQTGHGTVAPRSVVRDRDLTYYYSLDGFYRTNGNSIEPIGNNRVNRWFEENAAVQALDSMQGVIDRRRRLVIWAFRTSSGATFNNRIIIYNWAADRWSFGELDSQIISQYSPQGLNLDQLDTPLPDGIDIDSIGVDSDAFKRNIVSVAIFDSSNRTAVLAGSALPAEVDTVETLSPAGRRETVMSVRPLLESPGDAGISVSILEKRDEGSSILTETLAAPLNQIGEADVRSNSRRKRFRVRAEGRFDSLTGVEYRARTTAGRQ